MNFQPLAKLLARWALLAAFWPQAMPNCRAGIMLEGVSEQQYIDFSNQLQFACIGTLGGASGTLIAPDWVLTAGHLGPGVTQFFIRGSSTPYEVARVIQHPTWVANGGDINRGYDLQLVQLKTSVANVTPATIYTGNVELGQTVAITGYGVGGYGDEADTDTKLAAIQRAGTNTIDAIGSFAGGAQNAILIADFDANVAGYNTFASIGSSATPTALEYHLAGGDSGGGVFMEVNGQWFLIGVNSGVESQAQYLKTVGSNPNLFGYGALSYFTRVSSFQGFVESTITAVPEPGTYILLGLFAGTTLVVRRFRRTA